MRKIFEFKVFDVLNNQNKKIKRQKKVEDEEGKKQDLLKKIEPEINIINDILKTSLLKKDVLHFIQNDKVIADYFKSYFIHKNYKNLFLKELKKPIQLFHKIKI